jgi:hypothetical protein
VTVIVFKDLQKLVSQQQQQKARNDLYDRLIKKPFWIWDKEQHKQEYARTDGSCCFNHIICLPQKDGQDKPLYDYEQLIFDALVNSVNNNKHIWIKKAIGLGVSEFMPRFMAWLCLKDNALAGSQMCIVTGPRIELAIALIHRMKALFRKMEIYLSIFDTKETVIELNGVKIEAFPSHHLDAMRGKSIGLFTGGKARCCRNYVRNHCNPVLQLLLLLRYYLTKDRSHCRGGY